MGEIRLRLGALAMAIIFLIAGYKALPLIISDKQLGSFILNDKRFEALSLDINNMNNLKRHLVQGMPVIYGSSELTHRKDTFYPSSYLLKHDIPLYVIGAAGNQSLSIFSQISSTFDGEIKEHSRIIILLSPGWFYGGYSQGTHIDKFLTYMPPARILALKYSNSVANSFKMHVNHYLTQNEDKFTSSSAYSSFNNRKTSLDNLVFDRLINKISASDVSINDGNTALKWPDVNKNLTYDSNKKAAIEIEVARSTNNKFGIENSYFLKYVKDNLETGKYPITISDVPEMVENQEFKDLIVLFDFLEQFKIKPLFVMQDLHPEIYKYNREPLDKLYKKIKNHALKRKFGYLDLWTYEGGNYENGSLNDIMHTGELGWVKINQAILTHFSGADNES